MINPRADSECEQNSEFSATLFENVRERRDDLCFPDAPLIAHVPNAFILYKLISFLCSQKPYTDRVEKLIFPKL